MYVTSRYRCVDLVVSITLLDELCRSTVAANVNSAPRVIYEYPDLYFIFYLQHCWQSIYLAQHSVWALLSCRPSFNILYYSSSFLDQIAVWFARTRGTVFFLITLTFTCAADLYIFYLPPKLNRVVKVLDFGVLSVWLAPLKVLGEPDTVKELHLSQMSFTWDIKLAVPCTVFLCRSQ